MDRIELFRIFTRVVEVASFTRAANELGLPRSTVSAAVAELEGRVGARLLHRTTRKVSPTQDGAAFHERCVQVIADFEEVEGLFRQSGSRVEGKLKVDVPGRIGRLVIAPALPDFLDRYPGIDIMLGSTDRAVDLIEDGVDCALRVGTLSDSRLIARPIAKLTLINVASAAYLERFGTPIQPQDLDRHWAVKYASPASGRVEPWEWIESGELRTKMLRGRVVVNSAESYIACCRAGLGLIQVPQFDVRDQVTSGKLIEVMPKFRAQPMPMNLLYPHRQHLSRRHQLFADWLEQLLKRTII